MLPKLLSSLLVVLLVLVLSFSSFATYEFIGEDVIVHEREFISIDSQEGQELKNYTAKNQELKRLSLQNIIIIIPFNAGNDKISIFCTNDGLDPVDYVSCQVTVYDNNGLAQYQKVHYFYEIWPYFPQRDSLTVLNWSRVEITNLFIRNGNETAIGSNYTLIR